MLKNIVSLFACLLLSASSLNAGFVAGTLIYTPNGHLPIENLRENDLIFSYDFETSSIIQDKIIKLIKKKNDKIIHLSINNEFLEANLNQKIYSIKKNDLSNIDWIKSENIKKNQLTFSSNGFLRIDDVFESNTNNYVYDLSIEKNHNFFVSKNNILAHNTIPIIAWVAGEGISICWSGLAIVGSWIGLVAYKNYSSGGFNFQYPDGNKMRHIFGNQDHNFNGKDPEDIIDKIIKMLENAFKKGKLKSNHLYEESTNLNANEILVARGFVENGVTKIGTAFIKVVKP